MTGIGAFNDYKISSWKDGVMIRVVEYAKDVVGTVGKFVQPNLIGATVASAIFACAIVAGIAGSMPPVTIPTSGFADVHAHSPTVHPAQAYPVENRAILRSSVEDDFAAELQEMEHQLMTELAGLDDFSLDSIDPSSLAMAQEAVRQSESRINEDSEQWANRFFAVRS